MKLFNEKKYKEALPVLLSVAEAEHPNAALQVAFIYEKGLGMWFSDNKKAMQWYFKAAELKDPVAAIKVADAIYEGEFEATTQQMLNFYLLAVKVHNPEVTYKVALIYKNGFKDIKADDIKALQYLRMAAELGQAQAMYDLGIRYEKGQGVPINSKTSLSWIKKSADAGYEQAKKYMKQLLNQ
jgi:TPR repeat protein